MSEGSASKLSELLEASRPELEAAVADARRELRDLDEGRRGLDERRQELVSLITRAQAPWAKAKLRISARSRTART